MNKANKPAPKYSDLKQRILFLIGALIVFRLGAFIPIPGINPVAIQELFNAQGPGVLGMLNLFSGGALSRGTIFALGIMPYITSSIVVQLLTVVVPQLEALKKEGESGRKKISQYTRYGTLGVAFVQSLVMIGFLDSSGLAYRPGIGFWVIGSLTLVSGTMFLMWLGEQITERGIGNGISMLIFAGIVVGLFPAISDVKDMLNSGQMHAFSALMLVLIVIGVTTFVVFVERGQRRVLVNYAKRQVGNRLYGGQSSHVPLKLNMSGVMPAIFGSSILMFFLSILQFLGRGESKVAYWFRDVGALVMPGQPLYIGLFAFLIIFFCYFYTALMFNPKDIADNLKKSGAFIPGIRPGQQTASYLERVMLRLTLVGALYITFVCLLPEFISWNWGLQLGFGGTSLLIVVVVTMDFMAQVQANVMSYQYESLLKKTNFKGNMFSR